MTESMASSVSRERVEQDDTVLNGYRDPRLSRQSTPNAALNAEGEQSYSHRPHDSSADGEVPLEKVNSKKRRRQSHLSEKIEGVFSKLHPHGNGHSGEANDGTNEHPQSAFGRRLKSSVTMVDETYQNINSFKYSTFAAIRHFLYRIEDFLGPIVKKIIPNFIFAHYVYIIFMTILCSVIIYPQKNIEYIDALLFAAGTCTQGGLQTIETNKLKLYQQIVIYIICMLTTPIFIHGSLTFLRLYWYEKRFDNIKENSIRQYNMRRSRTIANLRSETIARTMTSAVSASHMQDHQKDRNYESHNASEGLASRMRRFEKNQKGPKREIPSINLNHDNNSSSLTSPEKLYNSDVDNNNHSPTRVDHLSEPSDSENFSLSDASSGEMDLQSSDDDDVDDDNEEDDHEQRREGRHQFGEGRPARTPYPHQHSSEDYFAPQNDIRHNNDDHIEASPDNDNDHDNDNDNDNDHEESPTRGNQNIKFGELPKPRKKKRDLDPRDLYMSISTLQNGFGSRSREDFESGPALHIKGPRELDEDNKKKHKLKGKKNRRLMKERRLQKLKKRGREMAEKERKFLQNEIKELKEEDLTSYLPASFDTGIQGKGRKTNRSLSMPEKGNQENSNFHDSETHANNIDESIDPISTNDRLINENLRKMQDAGEGKDSGHRFDHSHTMHDFSKRFFSKFDTRPNPSDISDDAITLSEDESEDDDHNKNGFNNRQRRTSFFGRGFTGMSRRRTRTMTDPMSMNDDELIDLYDLRKEPTNFLSWDPTIGRNSKFITLTSEEKAELGGVEYQSMKLLTKILVAYYVGFHIVCVIFLVAYINRKRNYREQLQEMAINPTWWAFFTSMSSFNDLGYTLNATSMMMFAQNAYTLLISGFFVLIGNTAFPIFLRFMIWIMRFFTRPLTMTHNSLSFLLEHPRRCFTLLFPSGPTWWLFAVLVFLNSFDWILFIILDYGSSTLSYLPHGYQVLAGLYQAFSTRTAGFNVVDIGTLHPAIQVSYLVMMYISVLPLAISIRRTNVYEEQSLGVYHGDDDINHENGSKVKFIGAHLRKQLSFDLWFLFLAIFIICIVEGGRIKQGDLNFGIFQIMFEVTSAYGTVGLSLGYPGINVSFSAKLSKLSKLVIVATLIRGRHRGLPNSIDRAIMLSNEKLDLRDDIEAYRAMRRNTTMSTDHESLFPSITRATTDASKRIKREPTIAENFHNGVIPWSQIGRKSLKILGHALTNILTVNGTPAERYTRQMTRYSTLDGMGHSRNRARSTLSERRHSSKVGYDDSIDLENGYEAGLVDEYHGEESTERMRKNRKHSHHKKKNRKRRASSAYGTSVYNNAESIPLQSMNGHQEEDDDDQKLRPETLHHLNSGETALHGDFMGRVHGLDEESEFLHKSNGRLQEGSSSDGV